MIRKLILVISIILINSCHSQTKRNNEISGGIKEDLHYLLQKGKFTADIMDGIKQSPRQAELNLKFQQAIQNNYEWFVEYLKTFEHGTPMPYHPNLGLTEKEFKEFDSFSKNIEVESTGKEDIEIIKNDSIISFKSNGKLKILETLKIYPDKNEISIGQYTLTYFGKVNVTDSTNAFKSKWKGYSWRYEYPENIEELDVLSDRDKLEIKLYKFTVGKLKKNGKTFLKIKGQELDKGIVKVKFEIPLIF